MTKFLLIASLFIIQFSYGQQFQGPVEVPATGYGTDDNHEVSFATSVSPLWPEKMVDIFYPTDITSPQPTIFFSHGYSRNAPDYYQDLFNHLVSRGYVVVFSPYQTDGLDDLLRYNTLFEGFRQAVHDHPDLIDSTKAGFVGHSFGGGATPAMTLQGLASGWGSQACFMMLLAPWYALNVTQDQLQSFPENVKMLIEVYQDDETNDHRIAIDLFNNTNIADTAKDYVMIASDTVGSYVYSAYHDLPLSGMQDSTGTIIGETDAYDAYAVYRLLDALADYALKGDSSARDVALGKRKCFTTGYGTTTATAAGIFSTHPCTTSYFLSVCLYRYPKSPRRLL